MLETIEKQDNKILLISEKEQQVFLPYTLKELEDYLDQFPDAYSSTDDVIKKDPSDSLLISTLHSIKNIIVILITLQINAKCLFLTILFLFSSFCL